MYAHAASENFYLKGFPMYKGTISLLIKKGLIPHKELTDQAFSMQEKENNRGLHWEASCSPCCCCKARQSIKTGRVYCMSVNICHILHINKLKSSIMEMDIIPLDRVVIAS